MTVTTDLLWSVFQFVDEDLLPPLLFDTHNRRRGSWEDAGQPALVALRDGTIAKLEQHFGARRVGCHPTLRNTLGRILMRIPDRVNLADPNTSFEYDWIVDVGGGDNGERNAQCIAGFLMVVVKMLHTIRDAVYEAEMEIGTCYMIDLTSVSNAALFIALALRRGDMRLVAEATQAAERVGGLTTCRQAE